MSPFQMNDDRGFQLTILATLQIMGNKRLVMLNRPDFVHIWAQHYQSLKSPICALISDLCPLWKPNAFKVGHVQRS